MYIVRLRRVLTLPKPILDFAEAILDLLYRMGAATELAC
jgi:hypothetical protein